MLSIVMPVWDISRDIEPMTRKAVKSIRKYTDGGFEIIVVLKGKAKFGEYSDLHPVVLSENASIAQMYNRGFYEAVGNYFCCFHNDVIATKHWNVPLQEEAKKGNVAFPMVKGEEIDPVPEWMPPGCCFVITRKDCSLLGGYDEVYEFMHGEDTDLFTRALKQGMKLIRCDSEVYHKRGGTRFLLPDKGLSALRTNLKKWTEKNMVNGEAYLPRLSNIGGN